MKKLILLTGVFASFAATKTISQQLTEGVIYYEVIVNMHKALPSENEEMKNMIPEFRTTRDQLFFNATESLFTPVIEEDPDEDLDNGEGMKIRMRRPMNSIYLNTGGLQRVMQRDFMGKMFIIQDTLQITPWKLEDETKEIKGYLCKKATYFNVERGETTTAWYTAKLRPYLGPENFNTLPGCVLEVDVNNGERVIKAAAIEFRAITREDLKKPSAGKKVTEKEFQKMIDEHRERIRKNGGNIIIRN